MPEKPKVDLFSQEFQANPRKHFAELLDQCPFGHSETGNFYTVARYEDIVRMCREPEVWSSKHGPGLGYQPPDQPNALVTVDPPEHDIEVEIVRRAFSSKFIRAMEPGIRRFVRERLDEIAPKGRCDLHAELSVPLPLFAICQLLGVDYADAEREGFRDWVIGSADNVLLDPLDTERRDASFAKVVRMWNYFQPKIEEWTRRIEAGEVSPDENLITRLVSAEHEGKRLPVNKILGFCQFLLVAGSATTTTVISSLVYRLIHEPEAFAKLRSDRSLLPNAIEESLRFDTPVHGLFRTNNCKVSLGPYPLEPDTKVMLLWGAGNVDPAFWENPHKFDIERDLTKLKRHLSFGYGIHLCLGATLARLEITVAMEELLDRIPRPRLNGEVRLSPPAVLGGPDSLPIAWD